MKAVIGFIGNMLRRYTLILTVANLTGIFLGFLFLVLVENYLARSPMTGPLLGKPGQPRLVNTKDADVNYAVIAERGLFRTSLQAEMPKERSEHEIEEDLLTSRVSQMTLKGTFLSQSGERYAMIDGGDRKGPAMYQAGKSAALGLIVSDIKEDTVLLSKGDFAFRLRLFSRGFERIKAAESPPTIAVSHGRDLR